MHPAALVPVHESQWHRGPDEGGFHGETDMGFGCRRLSVIDVLRALATPDVHARAVGSVSLR